MITECFQYLIEQDYEIEGLNSTLKKILNCLNEEQLIYILNNGLKINEKYVLYYNHGRGFLCMTENSHIYGNHPNCNVIEKKLNEKLMLLLS